MKKIRIDIDNCKIVDMTIHQIVQYCLNTHPEIKDLNPGSDYTEQYFDIECSADSITVVFRQEYLSYFES